jgi:hypothetical protein
MIISKSTALQQVAAGQARFSGRTVNEHGSPTHWIIDNLDEQRTDHVEVFDDESLIGCISCGAIVEPEEDARGCGCHCPECGATL